MLHVSFATGDWTDAGTDLPTCVGGNTVNCETSDNRVVDYETEEVNPLHAQTIDVAGHRYRVSDGRVLLLTLNARTLF